jgi:UDP-N-acetylmuramyl tripeptide synthase
LANLFTIALGKLVQKAARLKGGSGSAFPGLVVEKLEPDFAVRVLRSLPHGVVVVSGTNGKTTTTKIVTELLEAQGLKVFTNSTGSNFMRGVIASLLSRMTLLGKLDADIAVLELDEAHAVRFVERIAPRYALLLNVMRDQLDRFGEIDHTADLLALIARHTTEAVVVNREDNRLARFAGREGLLRGGARLYWYGLAPELAARFPQDDELYADEFGAWDPEPMDGVLDRGRSAEDDGGGGSGGGGGAAGGDGGGATADGADGAAAGDGAAPAVAVAPATVPAPAPTVATAPAPHSMPPAAETVLVTLEALDDAGGATYTIDGVSHHTTLELKGVYNAYNAAAALALVRVIGGDSVSDERLVGQLATVRSAFGRGESLVVDGRELELLLVKNPGGFRLALESFDARGVDTMIAINDEYADGRDMSWLFDVGFGALAQTGVAMVSGTRAWDMALRLRYDEVAFEAVDTQLEQALDRFIQVSARPMRLYCTYTAMLRCRSHLGRYTSVSKVE